VHLSIVGDLWRHFVLKRSRLRRRLLRGRLLHGRLCALHATVGN